MKLRTALQGAGVAALVLFPVYRNLIDIPSDLRMHTPLSATTLAVSLSLIANLLLVSSLFLFVGIWLRRTSRWAWLRRLVPALVLASLVEVVYIARTKWESTHVWVVTLAAILFLTLLLRWRWQKGEKILLQFTGAVLIGLGFFGIFVMVQLLYLATWHQPPNSTSGANTATTFRADQPRIIWILFDELSYQQLFGERFPNLQLPNFDEFRKSSTLFTDVRPVINETEKAIPSIFVNEAVERETYTAANQLEVGGATGALHPFDPAQTPFATAHQFGLTAGVVGWYNPYCVLLEPYVNQCYWTDEMLVPAVFSRTDFWEKLASPWVPYVMFMGHPMQVLSKSYRTKIVKDFMAPEGVRDRGRVDQNLMRRAVRMLEPSGPDFVFLHLPVPHPPGFYNRATQQFDISGQRSYIDNLALADRTLAQLLSVLKQSPRWKHTSVIISGDHSWRVYSWEHEPGWTAEDEAASHGGIFDPRPALIVHLAGQTTAATVDTPFSLLGVHDILNDLIQGKQPLYISGLH